jgi:cellulose synthase/poly-beta-1,6-N-acetylglucosamine synthase-like glycosyltransferase
MIISEEKPSVYAARNKGISIAKGEIYAFTDSDCQPQMDWLETAVTCFENNKTITRIGGKIELMFKSGKKLNCAEIYEKAFAFPQKDYVYKKGFAITGNMFSKKEIFDAVGLFNEKLMSGGDGEWGIRAQLQGSKIIYNEQCIVKHPARTQIAQIVQKTRRVAGGTLKISLSANAIKMVLSIPRNFLIPPFRSILKVVFNDLLDIKEKTVAVILALYFWINAVIEKMRILLLLKAVERQ